MARKASLQLAEQPLSLAGLGDHKGDSVVSVITIGGVTTVVSRVRDMKWHLWMYSHAPNRKNTQVTLDFSNVPAQFLEGVKDVFYRWWTAGMHSRGRPKAMTLVATLSRLRPFLRWLNEHGVRRLQDVTPFHASAFAQFIGERVGAATQALYLLDIQRLYQLREHSDDPLKRSPWPGSTPWEVAGVPFANQTGEAAKTKIIPDDVLAKVFQYAEGVMARAPSLIAERDRGERVLWRDPQVAEIRAAGIFLLGITSGMRNSEQSAIAVGAVRQEEIDGVSYAWLRSSAYKTTTGPSEWMVTADAVRWLSVLEAWARPYQVEARNQIERMKGEGPPASEQERVLWSQRLHELEQCKDLVFFSGQTESVGPMSNVNANLYLAQLFKAAGVDWDPESHQLRRSFAVACARHALGDLFYLKHHLKHRSLDMTALYAMNDEQDESLFQEIFTEIAAAKADLLVHWLDPETVLAGGAAAAMKANSVATVDSRRALAEDMASKVMIRATGHGWCLAEDDGCGGQGLYEKTRCIGCKKGLMDERHIPVWKGIYEQQKELLDDIPVLGPGGARRVQIDTDRSKSLLSQLGVKCDEA